jgi:hypothetical protein
MNYSKCLIITNSSSTNVKRALHLAGQLHDYFGHDLLDSIEISTLNYKQTSALIIKKTQHFDGSSLICVAAGDGTTSTVVNILLNETADSSQSRKSTILPLWGGNGNDLAIMANGFVQKVNLNKILNSGIPVAIHPILMELTTRKRTTFKLACCYASFGVVAKISQRLNLPSHRNRTIYKSSSIRMLSEGLISLESFLMAKPFTVDLENEQVTLFDLFLLNGPRIAKRERFPIKITDKQFVEASVTHKLPGLIFYILHAMNWRSSLPLSTEKKLIVHDPIWIQIDGEVSIVPKRTSIRIAVNKLPFYVLSTKLS